MSVIIVNETTRHMDYETLCQVKAYLDIISKWGGYFSHLSNIGFVLVKLNIFGSG